MAPNPIVHAPRYATPFRVTYFLRTKAARRKRTRVTLTYYSSVLDCPLCVVLITGSPRSHNKLACFQYSRYKYPTQRDTPEQAT